MPIVEDELKEEVVMVVALHESGIVGIHTGECRLDGIR